MASASSALQDKGKVDEAVGHYEQALHIDPKLAMAHVGLGVILCDVKGDPDGAIAHFQKAIALDPKDAIAHHNLGVALRAKGRAEEAVGHFHADGMVEHDGMVGELLKHLDDLGVADNTIVLYTTDNGAEIALWPDGAMTMFRSEKGTTWEGGMRIPMMVRWPGVVKPGTVYNDIISLIDWFPTLCAAAGAPDVKEKMASEKGFDAGGGKSFRVHLDGYNFMPYFQGKEKAGPRDTLYYFDQGGNLNAIRWNDWKLSFATTKGNIATGVREVPAWALITNLRMDPYERGLEEGGGALDFLARNIWLLVPIQGKVKEFFADYDKFPHQEGSSLNAGGIGYGLLRQAEAMKRLKELERFTPQR
jgi:arylsulfatase